jgi:hypothetical protein
MGSAVVFVLVWVHGKKFSFPFAKEGV